MTAKLTDLLNNALNQNHLKLNAIQQEKILSYLALLKKWNQAFNLTAITNDEEMIYLHIIDSLMIARFLKGQQILDVGTGAGLPGMPLAILNEGLQFTLMDKRSKKIIFLRQVLAELQLKNVTLIENRCEDFKPSTGFDTITARAFSDIKTFVNLTKHLLNKHGLLLAMKGKTLENNFSSFENDFQIKTVKLSIHGIEVKRHLVSMTKSDKG